MTVLGTELLNTVKKSRSCRVLVSCQISVGQEATETGCRFDDGSLRYPDSGGVATELKCQMLFVYCFES